MPANYHEPHNSLYIKIVVIPAYIDRKSASGEYHEEIWF